MPADEIAHGCRDQLDESRSLREIPADRSERPERVGETDGGEFAAAWRGRRNPVEADRHARACVPQEAWVAGRWARRRQNA
jgi:hypothetical protein